MNLAASRTSPADGTEDIASKDRVPTFVMLSLKMTLAQLAPVLGSLYLASLVARQGELLFSSYSLVTSINMTVFVAISGFLQALYYVGGRAIGRQDLGSYESAILAGFCLAMVCAGACTLLSVFVGTILASMRFDATLATVATIHGAVAAIGITPAMLLLVLRVHIALRERPGLVTLIYVMGAVVGAVVARGIVMRCHGLPATAALGVILSSGLANWIMLGAAVVALRVVPKLRISLKSRRGVLARLRPMVSLVAAIGWPIGGVILLETFASLTSSLLVGRYWLSAVPAHTAVLLWIAVCLVVPLGISQAVLQHVAILNAQGLQRARNRIALVSMIGGVVYGLMVTGLFAWKPERLVTLLLGANARVANQQKLLQELMVLGGVVLLCQSVTIIAAGILRGIGQTRAPFVQAMLGYVVIATGAQLLFGVLLAHGVVGVWWGLVCGFGIVAVAVTWRCYFEFRQGPALVAQTAK